MSMKKITIEIAGVSYSIMSDDEEEYVKSLADEINGKIQAITKNGSFVSPMQAEALVMLEYADTARKTEKEAESMRARLKEYLADSAQAKSERDMLKRENIKLKKSGKTDV